MVEELNAVNVAGFDNVALSMLTVFQTITLNGWSFAMYRVTDNVSPVATIYFVSLTILGAYVLVGHGCLGGGKRTHPVQQARRHAPKA